jgi:hypothetical protein
MEVVENPSLSSSERYFPPKRQYEMSGGEKL